MKFRKTLIIVASILILASCGSVAAEVSSSSRDSSIVYMPLMEIKAPKDETVYVNLDIDGDVKLINVVNHLENVEQGYLKDFGYFTDAINLTNKEKLVVEEDYAKIPIINDYEHFYYQTNLGRGYQLPFNIETSFFYNGREVDPKSIVGKSGKIDLVINVISNDKADKYFLDNYLCQIQLVLPLDQNKLLTSEKATKVLVGRSLNIAYMVLPRQSDSFTLSFETNRFEYQGLTATFSAFDINSMLGFDISLIPEYVNQLLGGMEQMRDGQVMLKDGLVELFDGFAMLSEGMNEIANGNTTLTNEAKAYFDGVNEISQNLDLLSNGLSQLASNGGSLDGGYQQILTGLNTFFDLINPLLNLNPTYREQIELLRSGLNDFGTGLNQYVEGVNMIATNLALLNDGMKTLAQNSSLLHDGMIQISEGNELLANSMLTIVNETSIIPSELDLMIDGQNQLIEAISEATKMIEDLPIGSDETIVSFTSPNNLHPRSVQFIIQQESVTLLK